MILNEETIINEMNSFGLPAYMQDGVISYLLHGIEPGSFLYAVLINDLALAVQKADATNGNLLKEWVCFVYNAFPMTAWRSSEIVENWIKRKRETV